MQLKSLQKQQEQSDQFGIVCHDGKVRGSIFAAQLSDPCIHIFTSVSASHLGVLSWCMGWSAWGQTFVSGRVTDAAGKYVLGANVLDVEEGKGVSTNIYGFYSITLPQRPPN